MPSANGPHGRFWVGLGRFWAGFGPVLAGFGLVLGRFGAGLDRFCAGFGPVWTGFWPRLVRLPLGWPLRAPGTDQKRLTTLDVYGDAAVRDLTPGW